MTVRWIKDEVIASLFLWPELVDHPANLDSRRAGGLRLEDLEGIDVFCLEGFLSGLYNHSAFYPHLNPLLGGEVGAFRNED